jgi:ABC-type bacteriocin/lantibiotic exporter with double-glycine peptidase domain
LFCTAPQLCASGPYCVNEQRSTVLCGPHSIYLLLRLHGIAVSYDRVMEETPVSADGMSMEDLRRKAESFGLTTEVVRCSVEDLAHMTHPIILRIQSESTSHRTGHFVVMTRVVDSDRLEVIDSTSSGFRYWQMKNLGNIWEGFALVPAASQKSPVGLMLLVMNVGGWIVIGAVCRALILNRRGR